MSDERRVTRRFIRLLVIGGAALLIEAAALGWWLGLVRVPVDDPPPERMAEDVDDLFARRFGVFDEAADVIWRYEEFFRYRRRDAALMDFLRDGEWPLESESDNPFMTSAERQAVLDLYALQPDDVVYYAPVEPYGGRCRAWGMAVTYRVPDAETPWKDGWREVTYLYARCKQRDHEEYPLTCDALRALILRATMNADTWEPLNEPCWHRVTRRAKRR